jgi:hypothetical protein
MSGLEEMLAEYAALDSAGRGEFSVDPSRQRELLGRLGLQNTRQGFVKLFQAIYLSGARRATCERPRKSQRLIVSFDFENAPPNPLWDIHSAFGLALLNLSQEYRIDWDLQYSGRRCQGKASPAGFVENRGAVCAEGSSRMVLTITRPGARWWHRDWTVTVRDAMLPRIAWTHRLQWTWDGQLVVPPALSYNANAVVFSDGFLPGNLNAQSTGDSSFRLLRQGDCRQEQEGKARPGSSLLSQPAHALLAKSLYAWSETFFVVAGVRGKGLRDLLGQPGLQAVVSGEGLTTSLNGLELVQDAALKERLLGLQPELSWLHRVGV